MLMVFAIKMQCLNRWSILFFFRMFTKTPFNTTTAGIMISFFSNSKMYIFAFFVDDNVTFYKNSCKFSRTIDKKQSTIPLMMTRHRIYNRDVQYLSFNKKLMVFSKGAKHTKLITYKTVLFESKKYFQNKNHHSKQFHSNLSKHFQFCTTSKEMQQMHSIFYAF